MVLCFLKYSLPLIPMKIGIMGAMLEEVSTIKDSMQISHEEMIAHRNYYSGKLNNIDTTLVFSRWGKVAASTTATTLINHHKIDLLVFTGIAGAVAPELNVGDIVIGTGLYQHDMDASPLYPKHHIPLTENAIFKPGQQQIAKTQRAVTKFIDNIEQNIQLETLKKFSIEKPKLYSGIIASGDQFISDAATNTNLQLKDTKVLAVEMEGAAVAQVCAEHEIPYIVIRTISDKADHSAHINFQDFLTTISSLYAHEIIKELYLELKEA